MKATKPDSDARTGSTPARTTGENTTREVIESLNRVVTHLMRRLRRIDDRQPIGRARLSALSVLVFGGVRTLTQLADDEGVTSATMHHVVQGLLADGLARKRTDTDDRRKMVIEVTPKGKTLMLKARDARFAMLAGGVRTLTTSEFNCLKRALTILSRWEL